MALEILFLQLSLLKQLNRLTKVSVEDSVRTLTQILPEETAEKAVEKLLANQTQGSTRADEENSLAPQQD